MTQITKGMDLEALRAEAREKALAEFKEIERKTLLATLLEEERAKLRPLENVKDGNPSDDIVEITIKVPDHVFIDRNYTPGVTINGKMYVNGVTYPVTRAVAACINHAMFSANKNEKSLGYPNRDNNPFTRIPVRSQPEGA